MKTLKQHINEALKIAKNISSFSTYSCQPKTKKELDGIIISRIEKEGPECDLNDIDVSQITDMSWMFAGSSFNGDISKWDVSNVEYMESMFTGSKFSCDISKWKINDKCDTYAMFYGCPIKEEYKPVLPE